MTELESCVLAALWRQGPMTAYQLRKEFERSPTSSWRASTGSIYPLIKRLHRQGLVEMKLVSADGRGTRQLVVSRAGRARVRDWLTVLPSWLGDATEDPIRTRIQFFDFLDRMIRSTAIAEMLDLTCMAITGMDESIAAADPASFERIALEGARDMLAARRDWLIRVKDLLLSDFPSAAEKTSTARRDHLK